MSAWIRYASALVATVLPFARAMAADGGDPVRNEWALAIQRKLLEIGIWQTGLHRLDDGALFGLVCAIVLMTFATSGLGLILFKTDGVGFRAGWLISIPPVLGTMLVYCKVRPYPTLADWPSMYLFAGMAALGCLTIARFLKTYLEERADRRRGSDHSEAAARLRLATRPGSGRTTR
jgi:hypothetical protein